ILWPPSAGHHAPGRRDRVASRVPDARAVGADGRTSGWARTRKPGTKRTPAPAGRRSLSPRPERGGTFRSCPGVVLWSARRPGRRTGRRPLDTVTRRQGANRGRGRDAGQPGGTAVHARGGPHRAVPPHPLIRGAAPGVGPREPADPNG